MKSRTESYFKIVRSPGRPTIYSIYGFTKVLVVISLNECWKQTRTRNLLPVLKYMTNRRKRRPERWEVNKGEEIENKWTREDWKFLCIFHKLYDICLIFLLCPLKNIRNSSGDSCIGSSEPGLTTKVWTSGRSMDSVSLSSRASITIFHDGSSHALVNHVFHWMRQQRSIFILTGIFIYT